MTEYEYLPKSDKRDGYWIFRANGDLIAKAETEEFAKIITDQLNASEKEIIICSAIKLPDGRIIRGHRHGDCIDTAIALIEWQNNPKSGVNGPPWHPSMCRDQGFITSKNRYVQREEALELQQNAGIPSFRGEYHEYQLFSEDLY